MDLFSGILIGLTAVGISYLAAATVAVRRFLVRAPDRGPERPAVTILKPLCGNEAGLEDNLRSFANLDYPSFQIVYGVRSSSDDVIPVVEKLIAERNDVNQELVVDECVQGKNLKVSSLRNMIPSAEHDLFVISDSDIRVTPEYLNEVVGQLADPGVGVVTCLYRAKPIDTIWSRFGALGINHGFFPAVLFSRLVGIDEGCFGATMAIRRGTLDEIGGFDSIKDLLSDDYALGEAVRKTGKKVVISRHVVDMIETSAKFRDLFLQEVRWGRTVRSVVPVGYVGSVITNPLIFGLLAAAFSGFSWPASTALLAALATRLWMTRTIDTYLEIRPAAMWMIPIRDLMSFGVYLASLTGSEVVWRDRRLHVRSGGQLTAAAESDT